MQCRYLIFFCVCVCDMWPACIQKKLISIFYVFYGYYQCAQYSLGLSCLHLDIKGDCILYYTNTPTDWVEIRRFLYKVH